MLHLKVVTPEKTILETEVNSVYLPAEDGEIGILPRHIPLLSALKVGIARYQTLSGNQEAIALMGGFVETDGKSITILTPAGELSDEVDTLRAQEAKSRAEAKLRETHDKVELDQTKMALYRALTRLKLSEMVKRKQH